MRKILSTLLLFMSFCLVSCDKRYTRIVMYQYGRGDITRSDEDFKAENDSAAFVESLQYFLLTKYGLQNENVAMFRVVDEHGNSVKCPDYISEEDWTEILALAGVYKPEDKEYVRSYYENFLCY